MISEELYNEILRKITAFEIAFDRRPTMLFIDHVSLTNLRIMQAPVRTDLALTGKIEGLEVFEAYSRFRPYGHPNIRIIEVA